MRATSNLIQQHQQTRAQLKDTREGASGAAPDLENHLRDPTFVRRLDLGREGATFAEIKRQV